MRRLAWLPVLLALGGCGGSSSADPRYDTQKAMSCIRGVQPAETVVAPLFEKKGLLTILFAEDRYDYEGYFLIVGYGADHAAAREGKARVRETPVGVFRSETAFGSDEGNVVYEALGPHVSEALGPHPEEGGQTLVLWYDSEFKAQDVDGAAAFMLRCRVPESGRMRVHELPAATMAATVHHGSYNTIGEAHEAILTWIEANEYQIAGPDREINLYHTMPIRLDDPSYVTEIQYPVEKEQQV